MKKKSKTRNHRSKNYAVLNKAVPQFVKWVKDQPALSWIEEIRCENGMSNILIKEGSRPQPAYKMDNPMADAQKAADTMNLFKENITIIVGGGLGYLVKAVLNKMEKGHKVIVVEPCGHMMRLMLGNFNFARHLTNGDLIIAAPGKEEVSYVLQVLSTQQVVSDWVLTINKYTQLRPDEYGELTALVQELLNSILCNTGTVAGEAGAKIADNDIACLPYVIQHRGVNELINLYKGKPAILVSTGPSLAKNIHHLIGLEDRVIIIAVGQALRVLLGYGITPDFICSVDFGEVNIGHYRGLMDSDVPLVTLNRTYAPLLKAWHGPKFIAATPVPGFEHMATGVLTKKGFVEAGGSVAHLCFGLAQLLGCNPIIFTGQDLALGETSHIPLADATGEVEIGENGQIDWKVRDQRCSLHGEKKYSMGPAVKVPGYFGEPVTTNLGLVSFITAFQSMIERHIEQ